MRLAHIIILFGFLVSCSPDPIIEDTADCDSSGIPAVNENHPKASVLRDALTSITQQGVPGVTLLVRDSSGLWIGSAGMADIEKEREMKPCHINRIASITKPMVVSVALLQYQQGKLNLDTPIAAYLDSEVADNIANTKTATVRQCMNHSSGIYDHISNLNFQTAVLNDPTYKWQAQELVKFAYGQPAYFTAGTDTRYSNINTVLIALAIEKVSRQNHGALLHSEIFTPLAMLNTFYFSYDDIWPSTAQGYFDLYDHDAAVNVSNYNTGIAHTAVYSTVYDLDKYLRALLVDKTLVSASTLAQMEDFIPTDDKYDYGLGLFRKKLGHDDAVQRAGIGHTGGEFGYSGKWFYYPDADVTIISLCNYGTNIESNIGNAYHRFHDNVEQIMMP